LRGATFQKACKKRGAVKNVNVVLSSGNPKESMPEIKPAVEKDDREIKENNNQSSS
jgi:hypothetical protein